MLVQELLDWLQVCPRDSEIFVSYEKKLGDEKKSKELINVLVDYGDDCVIFVTR